MNFQVVTKASANRFLYKNSNSSSHISFSQVLLNPLQECFNSLLFTFPVSSAVSRLSTSTSFNYGSINTTIEDVECSMASSHTYTSTVGIIMTPRSFQSRSETNSVDNMTPRQMVYSQETLLSSDGELSSYLNWSFEFESNRVTYGTLQNQVILTYSTLQNQVGLTLWYVVESGRLTYDTLQNQEG